MHRLVAVLFGVALALCVAPAAGAASSRGRAPDGVEQVVFVDYATANAAQPTADASSTDFHLLGGHPSWAASTVNYRVDASGCTGGGCAGATTAVISAFNTWQGVSAITFNEGTADANPCGGTDSVSWAPIDGPGGTLASTAVCRTTATKQIVGFRTVFDSGDPWSSSGATGAFDIQATATHEEGHTMGLDHVHSPFDARLTMYPFITPSDTGFRTLGCGELLGVNALFGTSLNCNAVPLD